MALVGIAQVYQGPLGIPVPQSTPVTAEAVTPSASSSVNANAALSRTIWEITTDSAIWVAFGPTPTAAPGTSYLMQAGQTRYWNSKVGDKVAVIPA